MTRTHAAAFAIVAAVATSPAYAQSPPAGEPRFFAGEITAGTIVAAELQTFGEFAGQADLTGPGFHILGGLAPARYFAPCNETLNCVPGFEVDLGAISFGHFSGFMIHGGRVTVNGETLQPANVWLGWPLLDADPVAIPRGNRKNLVLSAPFVLTDALTSSQVLEVRVYHEDDFLGQYPWAIGQITGAGVVTGFFERLRWSDGEPGKPRFYYVLRKLFYSFNDREDGR